jgi:hypothetical protein
VLAALALIGLSKTPMSFIYSKVKKTLPFVIAIMVTVGYMNDLHGVYGNYIKQKRAEDGLKLLNTGVSIQHVISIFGAPIMERIKGENDLKEYVYSFKNFYLQVVFENTNEVIFFAVTSKNENFHPTVPYIRKELGMRFSELAEAYTYNEVNWSSKFFEYNENIYLGNPGNYRNLYLASNPSGIQYGSASTGIFEVDERPNPSKKSSIEFREKSYPNTYGVGKILGGRDDGEADFGIGIEYFSSRDLPEHQY